ncbi:MAG: pectin acetylesterase-family hydrolase [Proteobacteria bacterium]|nr:pectin acetylesterase-family hydrolase [Pseudomonadota bacterium]
MRKINYLPGFSFAAILAAAILLGPACGGSSPGNPFQELVDQGITQYEGQARVTDVSFANGVTSYTFDPASGPMCLRGGTFRSAIRKTNSDELFIYLNGGGACWKEYCQAITQTHPGIPPLQILNPENVTNPVRSWNVSFVPYCDGSLFAGEAEHDDDGDGKIDRYHHGLRNLTAALEVTRENFPAPKRIFLAGSSAGSFGTIVATPLVRTVYPDIPIFVFEDSGTGIAKAEEPGFVAGLLEQYNATRFIPKSCPDCVANGHLTRLVGWALERDHRLKIGVFSSYRDKIYAQFFLGIGGEQFEKQLKKETSYLNGRFPDRYKLFLINGEMHTTLAGDVSVFLGDIDVGNFPVTEMVSLGGIDTTELNGVTIAEWIRRMLYDESDWVNETAQ